MEAIECLKNAITNLTDVVVELKEELNQERTEKKRPQQEEEEGEGTTSSPEPPTALETPPTHSPATCPPTEPPCPPPNPASLCDCGGCCGWRRAVYLNLSDSRYTCPAGWHLTPPPARGCGRASHDPGTCDSATFQVSGSYSEICGVVQGYQFGSTEAFLASNNNRSITIDDSYVTGVSITQGNPRQHVWTYAAGRYERGGGIAQYHFCPCDQATNTFIPSFVGACWYCESGNNSPYGIIGYHLFPNDVLWDGEGCRYTGRCCQFDGPLCFSRAFHEPMSGPIEVRICNYYSSQYSNVIISHLELYVR